MPRSSAVLAFFLFAGAEVLGAQSPGSFEITGFGRYSFFDDTLGLDDQVGGGGSLGFFFLSTSPSRPRPPRPALTGRREAQ